ncbi:MICOS subunit MIC26 [Trametes pubescens]|uniref:MICOS complex subunit n=1 Tax=Trametes pubescens TaxID=154538 RepID=A0A1M2W1J3_TRAPU|nr:MICOS subunit MIC26 [Trametes pubescens]
MLRALAGRRVFVAAAIAVGVHETRDKVHISTLRSFGSLAYYLALKLPIYPSPDSEVILVETPSELEKQIGVARRAVTTTYLDAHSRVQSVISRWIGVEQAVESRVKSLVAPDEPLTPGILYVGVATLTGSVLARNRIFWRLTLPPTLLVLSLNHFLPKTTHNVSSYLAELEEKHFPTFAEKHEIAKQHSAMTWYRLKDATQSGRETFSNGVADLVGKVEEATGLKLRETLGWRDRAVSAAEVKAHEVAEAAEESAVITNAVVDIKAEEAKAALVQKPEERKRLV